MIGEPVKTGSGLPRAVIARSAWGGPSSATNTSTLWSVFFPVSKSALDTKATTEPSALIAEARISAGNGPIGGVLVRLILVPVPVSARKMLG